MADSTISQFVSSGTTAERVAYTPDPPTPAAGPDPGYVWWDTDTQTEWSYDFGLADWVELASGGGGGLVLLEQHTASSSASLAFTTSFTSTYDNYLIKIGPLIPATDGATILLRVSTDGGSTYDSGANYEVDTFGWRYSVQPVVIGGGTGLTSIDLTGSLGQKNTASEGFTATIEVFNPLSAVTIKQFHGEVAGRDGTGTFYYGAVVKGRYLSATAVDAFQIVCGSGNIASGTVYVYGYAK